MKRCIRIEAGRLHRSTFEFLQCTNLVEIVEDLEVVLVVPGAQQREQVPVDAELLLQRPHLLQIRLSS